MERRGYDGNAILVGSVAKGTHLKNPDIDIFLRFPKELNREELKKLGIEIGRSILPEGFAKYAEHPYWRGVYNGFDVDIVPCYMIDSPDEKLSAVDRTPFHTEYVKKNLKVEQRDEVRLLKAFLKGIGAYGAEAKIQGFSGYLTELLILKYGNFTGALENVSRWRRRVYLYLEEKGEKFHAPVVFIDPVDKSRNAASAVSEEKKSLFIYASQSYLNHPRLEFFFPRDIVPLRREEIIKRVTGRGTHFYVLTLPKPDIIEDNLYPQIKRSLDVFLKILQDFHPVSSFFVVQDVVHFIIEVERNKLPRVRRHEGPPIWTDNSKDFLERWRGKAIRGPYIIGHRWYVDAERKYITVEEVLYANISNYKLGKSFEKMKDKIKIRKLENCINEIDAVSLTDFFDFKFPWER